MGRTKRKDRRKRRENEDRDESEVENGNMAKKDKGRAGEEIERKGRVSLGKGEKENEEIND